MKRYRFFAFVFMFFTLMVSCSAQGGESNMQISPIDKNAFGLISTVYTADQLNDIVSFTGSIHELNNLYKIECIRETSYGYRIMYRSDTQIAEVWVQNERITGGWIYNISENCVAFNAITVGQTIDDVKEIDPYGSYLFLYSGRGEPRESRHYTLDGFLIIIEYDEQYRVSNIQTALI